MISRGYKEGEISGDIKDILPPVDVPTSIKRLILWISVGLGALLLSGVIYGLVYKFRKRSKIQEQQSIRRTPHETAYELLERLSKGGFDCERFSQGVLLPYNKYFASLY